MNFSAISRKFVMNDIGTQQITIKKIWSDPVWSKVISTGIIFIFGAVAAYFLNWWPSIKSLAFDSFQFFLSRTPVPNWTIFLTFLFSVPTILALCISAWQRFYAPKASAPPWRSYNTDMYHGVRWRWSYFDDGTIYNQCTFCPHCDFQIFPRSSGSYYGHHSLEFRCDGCGRHLAEHNESYEMLKSKTERFVQQKLRNNTWQNK